METRHKQFTSKQLVDLFSKHNICPRALVEQRDVPLLSEDGRECGCVMQCVNIELGYPIHMVGGAHYSIEDEYSNGMRRGFDAAMFAKKIGTPVLGEPDSDRLSSNEEYRQGYRIGWNVVRILQGEINE